MPESKRTKQETEKFLATALKRFKLTAEAESEIRKHAQEDFEFRIGKQWPDDIMAARNSDKRPCLTMNRIPANIKQVANEQRQQRPAIQVNPVGDGADTDTAEIIQGMIRHIEVQSEAEIAYDNAFECMVTGGLGYFRLLTDYISDDSDDQEILIDWIENPFTVYFDPFCRKPDRSDGNFCFVIEDVPIEEYTAQNSDSLLKSAQDFASIGDAPDGWLTQETIRVAEYFYVEQTKSKSKTGREIVTRKVKWAKINAAEIMEEREWAGKWIPVIPVLGDSVIVDGKRHLSGLVRHVKDPQRQYNYMQSAATEAVALAPRAPWVTVAGTTENYPEWETANTRNHSRLRWDAIDVAGKQAPKPDRNAVEPPIQAIMGMVAQASNDMKAITGLYDPSLGQAKSDQSGKAIQSLQKQGDIGTLNYSDNLSRSMRFAGRQIIDLIPKIYDTDRIQRIINPDGSTKMVNTTNSARMQPPSEQPQSQAQEGMVQ